MFRPSAAINRIRRCARAHARLTAADATISLFTANNELIDTVNYDTTPWPASEKGVSIELSESSLNALGNDDGASWCAATVAFGDELATPGAPNSCP